MPNALSVSPAAPDKIVVNGCDLLNRSQLSASQNRELQRYIDENAHLLGFLDKPKEEQAEAKKPHGFNSYSLARNNTAGDYGTHSLGRNNTAGDYGFKRGTQSLNRINSPASDYGGKNRKGVSWSDMPERARSHSPTTPKSGSDYDNSRYANDSFSSPYGNDKSAMGDGNNDRYGSDTKKHNPFSDNKERSRTESPRDYWNRRPYYHSKDTLDDDRESAKADYLAWLKEREASPAYSTLQKHPDDYNRYETHRYRQRQNRKVYESDDSIKFHAYGDRLGSGIELTPKRWTGGEIIEDPTYLKKTLKPRRIYYSPIGDGVVAADGVEMKRGPPDLTPRKYITHERFVERGRRARDGLRIYEHLWDSGGDPNARDNGDGGGDPYGPNRGSGLSNGDPYPSGDPYSNGDGDPYGRGKGNGLGDGSPFDTLGSLGSRPRGDDSGPRSGRNSALSDGLPREGWTKTFIVNPRELINQYALETPTSIFDLDDHTPKTITTVKETLAPYEE